MAVSSLKSNAAPAGRGSPPRGAPPVADLELVRAACAGERPALRALVDRLAPVAEARVARALRRRAYLARGRDIRQEIEDVVQDVFLGLFKDECRQLASWEPERGLSLEGFVGLVAERRVSAMLRRHRSNPWSEDPTLAGDIPTAPEVRNPERVVASRRTLEAILDRVRATLSPKGMRFFQLIVAEQRPVEQVAELTGASLGTVYNWRSRFNKLLRSIVAELDTNPQARGGQP